MPLFENGMASIPSAGNPVVVNSTLCTLSAAIAPDWINMAGVRAARLRVPITVGAGAHALNANSRIEAGS